MSSCERCSLPADPDLGVGHPVRGPSTRPYAQGDPRGRSPVERSRSRSRRGNVLSVAFEPGDIEKILETIAQGLSEAELRDTRSLVLARGATATIADLMRTMPLSILISKVQERWLLEMLRERRLTTHFQPIVRANRRPRSTPTSACSGAARPTARSSRRPRCTPPPETPSSSFSSTERPGSPRSARRSSTEWPSGCSSTSTQARSTTRAYCLKTTISAIESTGIDPSRVVFEVVESDHVDVDLLGIVTSYRRAGFRVALDDLGEGYGSLNLLSRLRPDIVKLDMKLVRDVDRDRFKAGIASKLLEMARELGIATVAEGIETRGEFEWFRDQRGRLRPGLLHRPSGQPSAPTRQGSRRPSPGPDRDLTCPSRPISPILIGSRDGSIEAKVVEAMGTRVVLAMSGGVDSSVAAFLLKEQGHDVIGLFMRTGAHGDDGERRAKSCCGAADAVDARDVADRLDIPFYALDFERDFARIMDQFADEYAVGRTPNPCVMCNIWLKFGKLWAYGKQVGADFVATGHYARKVVDGPGTTQARERDSTRPRTSPTSSSGSVERSCPTSSCPSAVTPRPRSAPSPGPKTCPSPTSPIVKKSASSPTTTTCGSSAIVVPASRLPARSSTSMARPSAVTRGSRASPSVSGEGWGSPSVSLATSSRSSLKRKP